MALNKAQYGQIESPEEKESSYRPALTAVDTVSKGENDLR